MIVNDRKLNTLSKTCMDKITQTDKTLFKATAIRKKGHNCVRAQLFWNKGQQNS